MEKLASNLSPFSPSLLPSSPRPRHERLLSIRSRRVACFAACVLSLLTVTILQRILRSTDTWPHYSGGRKGVQGEEISYPFGRFPQADDPFRFLPCTNRTLPPALVDTDADKSWARLYDPDPSSWSWGKLTDGEDTGGLGSSSGSNSSSSGNSSNNSKKDPYAGRGIYLCGYLDVPLDWTNASDRRITRLAVTKFQVSGLAREDGGHDDDDDDDDDDDEPGRGRGCRSERTIVVEPGGPGGSGTSYVWRAGERITHRLSSGRFDVLGWDPRGVNGTQPAAACFPYDADRDRWWQLTHRYRAVAAADTAGQLAVADAMYAATMRACWEILGDLGRFVGTAMVARDLDAIRTALGEPQLTGYLVSYGTGIGQTYANMFPGRVGRVILDGTEFVPDEWQLGGFGWASLDNVTHAWRDGFLGECLAAGPAHCALARSQPGSSADGDTDEYTDGSSLDALEQRMVRLLSSVLARPRIATTAVSGPSIITYSALVAAVYSALYQPRTWPHVAQMLSDLELGNSTMAAALIDSLVWQYDPSAPLAPPGRAGDETGACPTAVPVPIPSTDELGMLVICADAFDAPQPVDGLRWWDRLWANMAQTSWISGNSRFYNVLPCRHYTDYWPQPAGVYRGPLNRTLAHPVLLVAETYDPATPLRNGRRLAAAMGHANARLVVHHGYGHLSSADPSDCTDTVLRALILHGRIPDDAETPCYANEKPYLYGVGRHVQNPASSELHTDEYATVWEDHVREMMLWNPGLARHGA